MSIVNELLQQANEAAEYEQDMNIATKGGGGGILYPEGVVMARLVEYIELGSHRVEYQGKLKDAAPMARLGFAIYGEGYQQEDGTPGIIRTYEFSLSTNEKAKAFKLFKKLNYKGTAKRFSQLLSEPYLLKIVHTKPKDATQKPRAIIDLEGFLPPHDPVSKSPYPVPAAPDEMYRLFLWNKPTKAMWDSLYVEGTFDDGNSKNFVQERCMAATDFPGSALEALLGGGASGIPSLAVAPATPSSAPASASIPADVPFEGAVPRTLPGSAIMQAPAPVTPAVPATLAVPAAVAPVVPVAPAIPAAVPSVPAVPTV